MVCKCLYCGKIFNEYRNFCNDICRENYRKSHPVFSELNPRIKRLKALAEKIQRDFNCSFKDRRHSANLAKKTYYYIARKQGYSLAESTAAIGRFNHTSALHMLKKITEEDMITISSYIGEDCNKKNKVLSEGERNRIRLNFRYDGV